MDNKDKKPAEELTKTANCPVSGADCGDCPVKPFCPFLIAAGVALLGVVGYFGWQWCNEKADKK